MLDWSQCPAVEHDPGKLSGSWVFRGTRVPTASWLRPNVTIVAAAIDSLKTGDYRELSFNA
jgi:uncharacterized protein (DUF433 family)